MDKICCPHCREEITLEIHVRTKEKGRGPRPHNPGIEIDNFILNAISEGVSLHKVAKLLNGRGVPTPRGDKWYAATVQRARDQALKRKQVKEEYNARGSFQHQ